MGKILYLLIFVLLLPSLILSFNNAQAVGFLWKAINFGGSLISDMSNVAGGCINGQILVYQTSNSTFICSSAGPLSLPF